VLLIKKKKGFPAYIVLTPSDLDEVSRVVTNRIKISGTPQERPTREVPRADF